MSAYFDSHTAAINERLSLEMKLHSCAALLGLACSAPAWAQTNFTVYGLIDTGVHIANTGNGSQANLASGIAEGSRIGFKGTEELGNGFKAIFTLESRFEADTGGNMNGYPTADVGTSLLTGTDSVLQLLGPAGGVVRTALIQRLHSEKIVNPNDALFDRTAMVGLITPAGAILLGRQYTPGYEVLALSDPFEAGTAGGWGNIAGGIGGYTTTGVAIRASDAIQYRLQLPNGFGASLMYAISGNDSANNGTGTGSLNYSKRFWGANARYQANGWNVGIGYNTEDDQTGNKSLTSLTIGGSYAVGNAKLFAGYHHMRNDNSALIGIANKELPEQGVPVPIASALATIIGNNAKLDANSYTVGMHYTFGSSRFITAISQTDDKLSTDAKATLFAVGYNYYLSKRTDLYGVVAHVENENTAQYGLGGAGYTSGFSSEPGQDANAVQLGIRHRF
jgi:general bacterial porin, GBP family